MFGFRVEVRGLGFLSLGYESGICDSDLDPEGDESQEEEKQKDIHNIYLDGATVAEPTFAQPLTPLPPKSFKNLQQAHEARVKPLERV